MRNQSVGLARIIYNMYGVYTVFLAANSPNIRSYTVYTYSSGQPKISVIGCIQLYGPARTQNVCVALQEPPLKFEVTSKHNTLVLCPKVPSIHTLQGTKGSPAPCQGSVHGGSPQHECIGASAIAAVPAAVGAAAAAAVGAAAVAAVGAVVVGRGGA
jgi:hypothetical protein